VHKAEFAAYNRRHYQAHKAQIAARVRNYQQAHKAELAAYRVARSAAPRRFLDAEKFERLRNARRIARGMLVQPRKGRGRPRGLSKETCERILLAAAFLLCGYSERRMAPYLFPSQPGSARTNVYRFFHDHRVRIVSAKEHLTPEEAHIRVDRLVKAPH
jgi:hypothetical protein